MSALHKIASCFFSAICGALVSFTAAADAPDTQWTYASNVLTEVVPDGQTPWKFYLYSSNGSLNPSQAGDSTVLNFRTLPEGCPAIVTIAGQVFRENNTIEEVYLPATATKISSYCFYKSGALRVCDIPEDSLLETIEAGVFTYCQVLEEIRLTDRLSTLSTPFAGCPKLKLSGHLMPDSLTTTGNAFLREQDGVIVGRLVFGGDDMHDVTIGGNYSFQKCTQLTELVFGAKVTAVEGTAFGSCSGITNVVCRNPDGFDFGTTALSGLTGLVQYDFHGWPQGKVTGRGVKMRILAPRDNAKWLAFVADSSRVTPWAQVSDADKAAYNAAFGDGLAPVGRIAATDQTYEGATLPKNVYVVFDKGEVAKTLFVKVGQDGADTPAVQPAFFPTCGTHANFEKDETLGAQFTCTAPRYSGDGRTLYEVSGYRVCVKGADGDFSVVAKEGTFTDGEAREFVFDTAELPQVTEFELTWKMGAEGVAYNPTFVAPFVDGFGTWEVVTEPNFNGYFLPGSDVTVSATGSEGHPFVMWGVEEVELEQRHEATMTFALNGPWTLHPIFKVDHWVAHNGGWTANYITDGYWKFAVDASFPTSTKELTVGALYTGYLASGYGEDLDFSLPVYFSSGTGADGSPCKLVALQQIRTSFPAEVLNRIRTITLSEDFRTSSDYVFYRSMTESLNNIEKITILGNTEMGNQTFCVKGALREVIVRGGNPAEQRLGRGIGGATNYAVVFRIPRGNAGWEELMADSAQFTPWKNVSKANREKFAEYHPGERHPLGLMTLKNNLGQSWYQWVAYEKPSGFAIILQ